MDGLFSDWQCRPMIPQRPVTPEVYNDVTSYDVSRCDVTRKRGNSSSSSSSSSSNSCRAVPSPTKSKRYKITLLELGNICDVTEGRRKCSSFSRFNYCYLTVYNKLTKIYWRDVTERVRRTQKQQHLWQFLLETLANPKYNPCYIEWLDRSRGIFRFVESQKIARLWGMRRKRANMSYEYFSRAMRSVVALTASRWATCHLTHCHWSK